MIYFSHITNPFQPNKGRIDRVLDEAKTIWQLFKEQKVDLSRPTICMINGVAVLRKFWHDIVSPLGEAFRPSRVIKHSLLKGLIECECSGAMTPTRSKHGNKYYEYYTPISLNNRNFFL